MRLVARISSGVLAVALVAASTVHAQGGPRFGVGLTGLFSLQSGGGSALGAIGLVEFRKHDQPIGFRADLTVAHGSGYTQEIATGDVVYAFHTPTASLHPYLLAGAGIVHAPGNTDPFAKLGAGFDYHLRQRNSGMVLFGEATFGLDFAGSGAGSYKSLQTNVGLKFGH